MKTRKFFSKHSREIFILSLVGLLIIGVFLTYGDFLNPFFNEEGEIPLKNNKENDTIKNNQVAILDQFYDEKPDFTDNAIKFFEEKNIDVDVYENITINLYRQLPTLGYKVIILRVHSATGYVSEEEVNWVTSLFTTEEYESSKYPILQTKGLVDAAEPRSEGDEKEMFAIKPKFVKNEMSGKFDDTLLIMNSCSIFNPKSDYKLLNSLFEKEVSAIVSWEVSVTLSHGDKATLNFLKHTLENKMTLLDAVMEVYEDVGPDPEHGAKLVVSDRGKNLKLKIKSGRLVLEK